MLSRSIVTQAAAMLSFAYSKPACHYWLTQNIISIDPDTTVGVT